MFSPICLGDLLNFFSYEIEIAEKNIIEKTMLGL